MVNTGWACGRLLLTFAVSLSMLSAYAFPAYVFAGGGGGDGSGSNAAESVSVNLGGDGGGPGIDFGFGDAWGFGQIIFTSGGGFGNDGSFGSGGSGNTGGGGGGGDGGWSPPPPPQCTPSFYCSANDLYYTNNSCASSFVQTCAYQCAGGACIVAPPPQFVPFTAILPNPPRGTGGTFLATGRLQVRPTLARAGDDAQIYWDLTNVTSCTVTGTNGSSWTGAFSGAAGKNTGTILTRTTFTLRCTALPTGNPPTVTESVIVNVAPSFNEN